ncbi:unnamed protein product [Arabis nemorensis]|uniref:Uncharacterized protein n=1 Tax=Arabis nemorensis TaxID=586526 RepID=A0A565AWU4_9BRAS|nr:unnamed protein product [Arabis nemorensis]
MAATSANTSSFEFDLLGFESETLGFVLGHGGDLELSFLVVLVSYSLAATSANIFRSFRLSGGEALGLSWSFIYERSVVCKKRKKKESRERKLS